MQYEGGSIENKTKAAVTFSCLAYDILSLLYVLLPWLFLSDEADGCCYGNSVCGYSLGRMHMLSVCFLCGFPPHVPYTAPHPLYLKMACATCLWLFPALSTLYQQKVPFSVLPFCAQMPSAIQETHTLFSHSLCLSGILCLLHCVVSAAWNKGHSDPMNTVALSTWKTNATTNTSQVRVEKETFHWWDKAYFRSRKKKSIPFPWRDSTSLSTCLLPVRGAGLENKVWCMLSSTGNCGEIIHLFQGCLVGVI